MVHRRAGGPLRCDAAASVRAPQHRPAQHRTAPPRPAVDNELTHLERRYLSIKQKRLHKPDGVAVYVRKMPHIRLLCNWKVAFTDHTEQNCILVHLLVNGVRARARTHANAHARFGALDADSTLPRVRACESSIRSSSSTRT